MAPARGHPGLDIAREAITPELVLVDPDLARRLRDREDIPAFESYLLGRHPGSSPATSVATSHEPGSGEEPLARNAGAQGPIPQSAPTTSQVEPFATTKPPPASPESARSGQGSSSGSAARPAAAAPAPVRPTNGMLAAGDATAPTDGIRLAWVAAAGAAAYRVEVFRGSQRLLTTTTTRPSFSLRRRWNDDGVVRRLSPGTYRWYVWQISATGVQDDSAIVRSILRVS